MAKTITTRHVTIISAEGERLKKAVWSRPRHWRKHKATESNIKQAITFANNKLNTDHIGTVVYVGNMPIYHTKWGGGKGFAGWKNNPVAGFWKRKLK